MNQLEQQVAALLQDAPGEPPGSIDADALLARDRHRRHVAPMIAAAAVIVAVVVPIAVFVTRGSTPARPGSASSAPPLAPGEVADPKAAAIKAAEDALRSAPLVPGSRAVSGPPTPLLNQPPSIPAVPTLVQRSRFWVAPASTASAIAYLTAHPPAGMHSDGSGSSGGPGQPTVQEIDFAAGSRFTFQYSVVAFRSGVAVRADAQVIWVPNRPAWAYVPGSVTSVDVTVMREAYNPHGGGAPTVRRTLTGDALDRLVGALNALPPAPPEGMHSCPAILVSGTEVAVFHAPGGDLRMERALDGCSFNATITAPPSKRHAYVGGNDFTDAILSALGLPRNYGFGSH